MSYDKVWIDETWRMIERCAQHEDCTARGCATVVLSPDGCAALIAQRAELNRELHDLRLIVPDHLKKFVRKQ